MTSWPASTAAASLEMSCLVMSGRSACRISQLLLLLLAQVEPAEAAPSRPPFGSASVGNPVPVAHAATSGSPVTISGRAPADSADSAT